jgi:hypothetical protein
VRRDAAKERAYQLVARRPLPASVIRAPRSPGAAWSLADRALQAGGPDLSHDAFSLGALRELGVALCRGSASLGRSGLYALDKNLTPADAGARGPRTLQKQKKGQSKKS